MCIRDRGNVGAALSVAVALAENDINNVVESYIKGADGDGTTDPTTGMGVKTTGAITVQAFENADIDALAVAASLAVGVSGGTAGIAVSGAGAAADNRIVTKTNAYVQDSRLESGGVVDITAENTSLIDATIVAASASVGVGNTVGAAVSIGAAFAQNTIGDTKIAANRSEVQAYVQNSSINAGGALTQTATANQTINAFVLAGSAAVAAGGTGGIAASGSGSRADNRIAIDVKS